MVLIVMIGVVCLIVVFIISTYNNLIKLRNKVKNSWAHIDAQLQRRFDLVPNLVETVKGFAEHEKTILENVVSARKGYISANTNKEKLNVNEQLNTCLKSLYVVAENYPQLKSNVNFLNLQNALAEIEEDITYARQFYNDAVTIYNNKQMMFPNNLIANMFHFEKESLFDAVKDAETAPKINFEPKLHSKYVQCPICGAEIVDIHNTNCTYCGCNLV